MRYCRRILTGCGAVLWLVTPAWAHPDSVPHTHGNELIPLLASAAVLGALLLRSAWKNRRSIAR